MRARKNDASGALLPNPTCEVGLTPPPNVSAVWITGLDARPRLGLWHWIAVFQ